MSAANQQRYLTLCHAMQSGVAMEMQRGTASTEPKHLRVGVNAAMVEHGALLKLLFAKGIITEDEWWQELADGMEREVRSYEERLSAALGIKVTLA